VTHYGGLTRAEAYRSGLAALREGLGTEAFLLGCGAPLQHAAGTLHAKSVNLDGRPYAVTIAIPRGMRVRTCKSDVACTVKPLESGGGALRGGMACRDYGGSGVVRDVRIEREALEAHLRTRETHALHHVTLRQQTDH